MSEAHIIPCADVSCQQWICERVRVPVTRAEKDARIVALESRLASLSAELAAVKAELAVWKTGACGSLGMKCAGALAPAQPEAMPCGCTATGSCSDLCAKCDGTRECPCATPPEAGWCSAHKQESSKCPQYCRDGFGVAIDVGFWAALGAPAARKCKVCHGNPKGVVDGTPSTGWVPCPSCQP